MGRECVLLHPWDNKNTSRFNIYLRTCSLVKKEKIRYDNTNPSSLVVKQERKYWIFNIFGNICWYIFATSPSLRSSSVSKVFRITSYLSTLHKKTTLFIRMSAFTALNAQAFRMRSSSFTESSSASSAGLRGARALSRRHNVKIYRCVSLSSSQQQRSTSSWSREESSNTSTTSGRQQLVEVLQKSTRNSKKRGSGVIVGVRNSSNSRNYYSLTNNENDHSSTSSSEERKKVYTPQKNWWGTGSYTNSVFSKKVVTRAATNNFSAYASSDNNNNSNNEIFKGNAFLNLFLGPPLKILGALWKRLAKPLQDFGFGRTRIVEGGVGLFIVGGVMLGALITGWIVGIFNNARKNSYQAFIEFPLACGIQVGTNVRIRGVKAGTVLSVQPALDKVTVLVEMDDKKVPIPRNSTIDANQSGLIAETIIDITPKLPIPQAQWGPLDAGCEGEGVVVCDRGRIQGRPGVSMDDLVGICTRLAREMEQQDGIRKMFQVTDGAQDLMQVLEPLLTEAALIARDLRPMMQGVKDQGTLETIELLAGHASATVQDIRELRQTILTEENQDMLRQSISTLTKTLQHVEKVSGDISSVSGDRALEPTCDT